MYFLIVFQQKLYIFSRTLSDYVQQSDLGIDKKVEN